MTKVKRKSLSSKGKKITEKVAPSTSKSIIASPQSDADIDQHPLQIGNHIVVQFRDKSHRLARIISKAERKVDGGDTKIWWYYVHYCEFNRRMDEWIDQNKIVSFPSVANPIFVNSNIVHGMVITALTTDEQSDENSSGEESDESEEEKYIMDHEHDEHAGMDEAALKEHEEITKIKNIQRVLLGRFYIECWYFSPYPRDVIAQGSESFGAVDCLYICEFTFRYFRHKSELERFQKILLPPEDRHPPGNEIYRDERVSMFEVDGAVEKIYCQNVCYFAKLFLDHKTLYWDVDPFLFYILTVRDDRGYHPVGFFSKEKYSEAGYNLACILTFPFAQRKGYGRFLIEFSYELSKREGKIGSPEKPLSDLGAVSYRSYWACSVLQALKTFDEKRRVYDPVTSTSNLGSIKFLSVAEISYATSILQEDVILALNHMNLLVKIENPNAPKSDITNAEPTAPIVKASTVPSHLYFIDAPNDKITALLALYTPVDPTVDEDKSSSYSLLAATRFRADCIQWSPLYVTDYRKDKWSILAQQEGISFSN